MVIRSSHLSDTRTPAPTLGWISHEGVAGFFSSDFSSLSFAFGLFLVLLLVFSIPLGALHYSVDDVSVCACQFATFKLHVENLQSTPGHQDFSLVADPSIQGPPDFVHVQLNGLQSTIVPIDVYARCDASVGSHVVSFVPFDSSNSILASVQVDACDGLTLDVTPRQALCQNDHADYAVTVRNLAGVPRNVTLGTDLNPDSYVLPQSIHLLAHQSQTVVLSVNTNTLPQRLPFRVVARTDDGVFVEQPALINVVACSGMSVSGPSNVSLLEGQNESVSIDFQNLGATSTVRLESFCPSFVMTNVSAVAISPNEKATVIVAIQSAPQGTYSCSLRATSQEDGRVFMHTLAIAVAPSSSRYVVTPAEFTLEQGVLQNVTFHVHNGGLLESVPVSFASNATSVTAGPRHASARMDQDLVFYTDADCHGYELVLTHGGARRQCPEPSTGRLVIGGQSIRVLLHVRPPTLIFDSQVYSVPTGVRVDFVLTNTGDAAVVQLSANPPARGPSSIAVGAKSQAFFSIFVDGNASSLRLQAQTGRGIYSTQTDLAHPQPAASTSGLVTLATPVIAFSVAVLLALALLYLLYRRGQVSAG